MNIKLYYDEFADENVFDNKVVGEELEEYMKQAFPNVLVWYATDGNSVEIQDVSTNDQVSGNLKGVSSFDYLCNWLRGNGYKNL